MSTVQQENIQALLLERLEQDILVLDGAMGTMVYALKRPNLLQGRFGFHDLFHVFVLLGAGFHYALVYGAVAVGT